MSIQSEITRIQNKRDLSLQAVANKGVTVPAGSTIDDLPGLIALIETGSGGGGSVYQDGDGYIVISDQGGGSSSGAVGIVDTIDEHGGTIRQITAVSLENDTVTPATLASGVTAHDSTGQAIVGTASIGGYDLNDVAMNNYDDENIVLETATFIHAFAFAGTNIKSISAPLVTGSNTVNGQGCYVFYGCTQLTSIDLPLYANFGAGGYQFASCTSLVTVHLPSLAGTGQYMFANCNNLVTAVFGSAVTGNGGNMNSQGFRSCTKLKTLDLKTTRVYTNEFYGCTVFDTLIIRSGAVPTLSNINSFTNTPFASGKAGGTLYVPQSLIESYQAATNWSTILGYENNQILPIEGSIYETQYADGTPIETT